MKPANSSFNAAADDLTCLVVVNQEGQYSIWPAARVPPAGWRHTGKTGDKSECLEYIRRVWTDMRPLSMPRTQAEAIAQESGA